LLAALGGKGDEAGHALSCHRLQAPLDLGGRFGLRRRASGQDPSRDDQTSEHQ
jgi:hypothetical protein